MATWASILVWNFASSGVGWAPPWEAEMMYRRWYWSRSRGLSFSWSCWGFPGWLDVVTIFQVISSSSWSLVQWHEPSKPHLTRSWDWNLVDREWPLIREKLMLKKMVLMCRSRKRMACFVFLVLFCLNLNLRQNLVWSGYSQWLCFILGIHF